MTRAQVLAVQQWLRAGAPPEETPSAEVMQDLLGIALAGVAGSDQLHEQRDKARPLVRTFAAIGQPFDVRRSDYLEEDDRG